MNYPLWDVPGAGLLIAFIAIIHVFISHFAVGGGLYLVLAERRARRERDDAFLDFVRAHSRFFVLLTLVGGAMTGVGIWFTIGLVHPAATSTLINTFVWGWAIEWTFFVAEIAAAMVYLYGWDRLSPGVHMAVGWIYFGAAWLSLAVINGILSFMLTPGAWLETRRFWDGILNPTYVPSVVARTFGSMALAGVYAVFTATWLTDAATRARIARYSARSWILPAALGLPLAALWTLAAASNAGVPVRQILGLLDPAAGQPVARTAAVAMVGASVAALLLVAGGVLRRPHAYGRPVAALLMAAAFVALGSAEWLREVLRKPYVIGGYMYVNGVRVPADAGDRFSVAALNEAGVLETVRWRRPASRSADEIDRLAADGEEVFRLECSSCHTQTGYLGIRPLVKGASAGAMHTMIRRLDTWRGRRMPPFVGTAYERQALATYLARTGGATREALVAQRQAGATASAYFEENCSLCHGADAEFPFDARGRSADELQALLGRLPEINDVMPPFEGSDELRRALAEYLAGLPAPATTEAVR